MTQQEHARITDEMIESLRSRIGLDLRVPIFNEVATKDAIRHWCQGMGDDNPLYLDTDYASKTRYGCIIAPPCWLYSVHWPGGLVGLPGIHGFHSGNDWEWFIPIKVNDQIIAQRKLYDVVEKPSRFAGRLVIVYTKVKYFNPRDELISTSIGWSVRTERQASQEKGKYAEIRKATYTPEELRAIEDASEAEEIRGANRCYWEDVKIGDEMGPIIKGPLTMRDIIAWTIGNGSPFMRAHRYALRYRRRHPAVEMIDRTTGQVDVPELVHMEDTRAGEIGIPGAYDYGSQRMSWLGHLLSNWQGDDGATRKLHGELRMFNVIGDTQWIRGKITRKYVEKDEHLVDCDISCTNQRGEVTAPGNATLALPSRTLEGF
ncbi:MAG: MaoC family dehydratase N-terminal domain-containing protein [Chloroflexi bacterium]|nr:MaoC family dehydratase N-terminal domain-containing protein [Chloroflexota bacterium]